MTAIARLAFYRPALAEGRIEELYAEHLAPFFAEKGLVEAAPIEGAVSQYWCRYFEVGNPERFRTLKLDFRQLDLSAFFTDQEEASPGGYASCFFELVAADAGQGTSKVAGTGYYYKSWLNFSQHDGMLTAIVFSCIEDSEGNIWLATNEGACRFDGSTFTTFTRKDGLPTDPVRSVLEDRSGNLWFGTEEGVCCYSGQKVRNYTVVDGLVDNSISCMVQDRAGDIWFGTWYWFGRPGGGLNSFDGKRMRSYTQADGLSDDSIFCLLEDRRGKLWVGTGKGLCRFEGKRFKAFGLDPGLGPEVCSLSERANGDLWVGTSKGVGVFANGPAVLPFTPAEELAEGRIMGLTEGRDQKVWFGLSTGGLYCYDGRFYEAPHASAEGLNNNGVNYMLEDRWGNIWVCTMGGGINRFEGRRFEYFTVEDGLLDNGVLCAYEDKVEGIWFGSLSGVSYWDGKDFAPFQADKIKAKVWCIFQDGQSKLWFGTNVGLFAWDGRKLHCYTSADGLAFDNINSIFQDDKGVLWLGHGSKGGVSFLKDDAFKKTAGVKRGPCPRHLPKQRRRSLVRL